MLNLEEMEVLENPKNRDLSVNVPFKGFIVILIYDAILTHLSHVNPN